MREKAEYSLEQLKVVEGDLRNQVVVLEEKKKEAEATIENLLQEVELQKATKEEIGKQVSVLQDNLQKEVQAKEELRTRLNQDLQSAQEKYNVVKAELDKAMARNKELENSRTTLEAKLQEFQQGPAIVQAPVTESVKPLSLTSSSASGGVELGKIVVNPSPSAAGKVINVDVATDFVIVNLGEKDGVSNGTVLSIFRGENYLGDVKVSRVLASMSAADFIPPLKSESVKKDDQVTFKK